MLQPLDVRDRAPDPCAVLAAAVIRAALTDVRSVPNAASRDRLRRWFASAQRVPGSFVFWCDVAGLDPVGVRALIAATARVRRLRAAGVVRATH